MRKCVLFASLMLLMVVSIPVRADLTELQGIIDDITTYPNPGQSSVDVDTDMLDDDSDSYWSIGGTGGAISVVIEQMDTGYDGINVFGLYDFADPSKKVEIFNGSSSTGSQALISILADGSVYVSSSDTNLDFAANAFGFYVEGYSESDLTAALRDAEIEREIFYTWYSDSLLNIGEEDHMYAYEGGLGDKVQIDPFAEGPWGANEYILAWEIDGETTDFADFVVMVESVSPVPVPGAILLGLLGMSAAGIRLRRFA